MRMKSALESVDIPRRVLLVEPSRLESWQIHQDLVNGQLEVHDSGDMITAFNSVSIFQPTLILAQLRLPTYNGLELVRRLKEDPSTSPIPIILYADFAAPEERVRAFDLGAADFITKPFVAAELLARVRAGLKARHTLTMLERRAHLDGLTGLANRAVLEDTLSREWDSCRRRGTSLTTIIADLDRFKRVNDAYGHATGDEVLRQAAHVLAHSARSTDLVARYGGEELVIVAPDCSVTAAVTVAKRFRAGLHALRIPVNTGVLTVSASIGIASTDDMSTGTASGLLQLADHALYQAKDSGRDAIWFHDPNAGAPAVAVPSGAPLD
jgi:two-component system, cell cycle response regulator